MGELTFILGGARSGKSSKALELASLAAGDAPVLFIATAQALDSEMDLRISKHKIDRPAHWMTVEEPFNPASVFKNASSDIRAVIVDCITLLTSNIMFQDGRTGLEYDAEERAIRAVRDLVSQARMFSAPVYIVSNEIGLGIVPDNVLARVFRDIAGRANQMIAADSDNVLFMTAGIAIKVKGK
jgi:adenosylcobinamide kinase/adenosylcobinamide-phosphate guanylyltransferase